MRWFELALVLAIAFLRPLTGSIHIFMSGQEKFAGTSPLGWVFAAASDVLVIVLLGYVLARSGRKFWDIGLRWSFADCGVGVALAVRALIVNAIGAGVIAVALNELGISVSHTTNHYWGRGTFWTPWSFLYLLVTPAFEELLVRAYLMTELIELTGSTALSVVASTLFQASYHIYYGWFGVTTVALIFVTFALYFARYRRALPCIVAHETYDLIATLFAR
ncbi:MAG: CPBP family intramembrane glutamic endopeptidase [Candidatus Acidiferrales bacterium]